MSLLDWCFQLLLGHCIWTASSGVRVRGQARFVRQVCCCSCLLWHTAADPNPLKWSHFPTDHSRLVTFACESPSTGNVSFCDLLKEACLWLPTARALLLLGWTHACKHMSHQFSAPLSHASQHMHCCLSLTQSDCPLQGNLNSWRDISRPTLNDCSIYAAFHWSQWLVNLEWLIGSNVLHRSCSAAFGGHNGRISAVVRAADGRLQHVLDGKVGLWQK